MTLKVASAFTGIAGFEKPWLDLGMSLTVMIEKDNHCRKVLAEHLPGVPLLGDIYGVSGTEIGRPDVLVGGFPCRGLTLGKANRQGLRDEESRSFFEFIRLAEECGRLIEATRPRWVVMENSAELPKFDQGRDMATIACLLQELGYGWAFRVVDAQHFGTPQRRRRVIVVGHRGGDPRPAGQVLGLTGPGCDPDGEGDAGLADTGPGPTPVPVGGDLVRVWRKGANSQVAIRFHDHPTCPPPAANGRYPKHQCRGTYNPDYQETWVNDGSANALTGFDGGGPTRQKHLIHQHGRLRTLTLTEWERLQGFPDGWTAMIPNTARSKALGNAMHTGMARHFGIRLLSVHESLPQLRSTA